MVTEFFPKGAEHLMSTEVGCHIGSRRLDCPNWPAFSWSVHPEEGVRRIIDAGGAQDAWGRDYTPAEFEAMLRDCAVQAIHEESCASRTPTGDET